MAESIYPPLIEALDRQNRATMKWIMDDELARFVFGAPGEHFPKDEWERRKRALVEPVSEKTS